MTVQDWNGSQVPAVRSKGGVIAFPDYRSNLVKPDACVWPPPELVQKLCRSDRISAFLPDDQPTLTQQLGYYTDLQSVHSEDAIQWSFFGSLVYGSQESRVDFSNWIAEMLNLPYRNEVCTMALWRRVPHPDTLGSGGPELDLLVSGNAFVIVAESKWRSGEGRWQGMAGNKTQLQLRQQFLLTSGSRLFEGKAVIVLYIVLDRSQLALTVAETSSVPTFSCHWADLCEWTAHPQAAELRRYYEWKRNLVVRSFGVPAPGRRLVSVDT